MKKWIIGLIALSFAPIWRDPAWEGGKNAWQALYNIATGDQKPHIPVDAAVSAAREAYSKSKA